MVERIRALLETRQLTPTQFADAIGIARPIVSHILSGRNKPSLEVVQRILAAMPDLSISWLLNGMGPMLTAVANTLPPPVAKPERALVKEPAVKQVVESEPNNSPQSISQVSSVTDPPRAQLTPAEAGTPARLAAPVVKKAQPALKRFIPEVPKPVPAASDEIAAPMVPQPEVLSAPVPAQKAPLAVAAITEPVASNAQLPSLASALLAGNEKPIRRIVIFYRDGSFADYQPEQ